MKLRDNKHRVLENLLFITNGIRDSSGMCDALVISATRTLARFTPLAKRGAIIRMDFASRWIYLRFSARVSTVPFVFCVLIE